MSHPEYAIVRIRSTRVSSANRALCLGHDPRLAVPAVAVNLLEKLASLICMHCSGQFQCVLASGVPLVRLDRPETFTQKPARSNTSRFNSSPTLLQQTSCCKYNGYGYLPPIIRLTLPVPPVTLDANWYNHALCRSPFPRRVDSRLALTKQTCIPASCESMG
jgi:hypothetical protein